MNNRVQNTFIVLSLLLTGVLSLGVIRYAAQIVYAQTLSSSDLLNRVNPTSLAQAHPCPEKAQTGDYDCSDKADYDDFTIFKRDYLRGDNPLAPFFEWIRSPLFDNSTASTPTPSVPPEADTHVPITPSTSPQATQPPQSSPTASPTPAVDVATHITHVISQVDQASIQANLEAITDNDATQDKDEAQTRYTGTQGNATEATYIKTFFENAGIEVELQPFSVQGTQTNNVVARIYGTDRNNWYLATAHMDSISENARTAAPGADDNGSGTVTVMEIAKAIKNAAIPLNRSLEFILFSGEELGLHGSYYYVDRLPSNKNIVGVINLDMIGNDGSPADCVKMNYKSRSGGNLISDTVVDVNREFSIGLNTDSVPTTNTRSDHYPFWRKNIPAIFGHECEFSPVYHSTRDKTDHISYTQLSKTAKAVAGALVKMSFEGQGFQLLSEQPDVLGSSQNLAQAQESSNSVLLSPSPAQVQQADILAYTHYTSAEQLSRLQSLSTHFIAYIEEEYIETPVYLGLFSQQGIDQAQREDFALTILDQNADLTKYVYLFHPKSGQTALLAELGTATEIAPQYYLVKLNPGKTFDHSGLTAQFFDLPLPLNEVKPQYETVMVTLAPTHTPAAAQPELTPASSNTQALPAAIAGGIITLLGTCLIVFYVIHKKRQML